jgi:hypothetical protein
MNLLEFNQNEELEQLVKSETVENYELPPDIIDLAERVSYAVTLLCKKVMSGKPDYVLVKKIMDVKLCSRPTALKALQLAKALMVRTNPIDVNYQKLWLDTSIKRNIAKGEEGGTPKDRDAISKEHKNLIKLHGLDKEQGEAQRNVLIINVINHNPELIGAQKRGNIKGDVLAAIEAAKTKQEKQFGEILDITALQKEYDDSEES